MKASEFRKLIREEVRRMVHEEIKPPVSLQGKHTNGSIIVALFFDSSKQKNNAQGLWDKVITMCEQTGCTIRRYYVTDSVCELEFKPDDRRPEYGKIVRQIEVELAKMKSMITTYDIYTI